MEAEAADDIELGLPICGNYKTFFNQCIAHLIDFAYFLNFRKSANFLCQETKPQILEHMVTHSRFCHFVLDFIDISY
jgi:hypothetical protein